MDTFEALGLDPAVVEALAAEGVETPNDLQRTAIPALRRGTSTVLQAAPGSGLLVAWGAPMLDRLPRERGQPSAIVIVSSRERAEFLAVSLARLTTGTGHRVGALGLPWARPESSDILVSTLDDLDVSVSSAKVKLDGVEWLVLELAEAFLEPSAENRLTGILGAVPKAELQVTVVCDRVTLPIRRWVEEHLRRAVYIPPEAARGESPRAPAARGTLRVQVSEGGDIAGAISRILSRLLDEKAVSHMLVYAKSDDDAADLGDQLALRGFVVGRPGEADAEVWLGVDPLEVREELAGLEIDASSFAIFSADPPMDADALDRRHGGGGSLGIVITPPRSLPHLRRAAKEAGYALEFEGPVAYDASERAEEFRRAVEAALENEDLVPYLVLLEPLMGRYGAAEVAAALAALLRKKSPPMGTNEQASGVGPGTMTTPAHRPPAWARVFLSVGQRDGVGPRDLLGAILGESGVRADQVGRIDMKDHFSRVEVHDSVADRVIGSLNGISIRGRSVRADFDRGEARGAGQPGARKRAAPDAGERRGTPRSEPREPKAER